VRLAALAGGWSPLRRRTAHTGRWVSVTHRPGTSPTWTTPDPWSRLARPRWRSRRRSRHPFRARSSSFPPGFGGRGPRPPRSPWFVLRPIRARSTHGNWHRWPDRPDHHHHSDPARAL